MFGKRKKTANSFEETLQRAKYDRLLSTLRDVHKTDIKTVDSAGKEVTDYKAMCEAMKLKVKYALDFISNLESEDSGM